MLKTCFSLEISSRENAVLFPESEEEIILQFGKNFLERFNADECTYNVFVRDFFDSISYYQIPGENIQGTIGTLKRIFHKSYNIIMHVERICSQVFVKSFGSEEARALLARFNKENLRHWVLEKFRAASLASGKRQAWEDSACLPLYQGLAELAESNGLFEKGRRTIEEFLLNLNSDGNPPALRIRTGMTSHVAIFLGMLKHYKLIHGRYQKIIQEKGCLVGAEGTPVSSSTLSSAKYLYWYRFEDGDDLVKNQDTPVDALITAFREVYANFREKTTKNP